VRQRLLLKPGGFEGISPPREPLDPSDLAVVYQEVDGELLVELDVAGAASQLGA
jgi:hypothetical protein